jgi:uncharacterized protein YndB with AHSA1/START domain
MSRIRVSVEIARPPADVWSVVEPIEHHVDWMADAIEIRFTGALTRGVGTTFECDTRVGPIKLTDVMTITEWEPPRSMGVRHAGVVSGTGIFVLEPIDLGRRTRFIWTEDLDIPWFLGGRLGAVAGGRAVMRRIWAGNLARLKSLLENQPS